MDIKEEQKKGAVSGTVINIELLLKPWPNGLAGRRKLKT